MRYWTEWEVRISFYLLLLLFHSCLMLQCGSFNVAPSQEYWLHHELIHGLSSFREVPFLPQSIFQFSDLAILSVLSSSSCFLPLLRLFHRGTKSLADGLSCGSECVLVGTAMSGTGQPLASSSHRGPICSPSAAKPFHWHLTQPLRDECLRP